MENWNRINGLQPIKLVTDGRRLGKQPLHGRCHPLIVTYIFYNHKQHREEVQMKAITVFIVGAFMMVGMSMTSNAYEGEWRNPDRPGSQEWQGSRDWHRGPDWHGSIRERIREDHRRIERGFERGSLTRREARRLGAELDHILDKIDWLRRDGRLNRTEREVIHRDLDRLEREIRREKRDDDRRREWREDDNTLRFEFNL